MIEPKRLSAMAVSVLNRLAESRVFAYTAILLLQLKVIWGMWQYRDLTFGDTSSYFVNAVDWFANGKTVFLWSPMYSMFYAAFLHITTDAAVATTLHRMAIVLALAVLVLAVMRRLLPPPIAWLATAWWIVLPTNFDTLYEVHLFAVIPLLAAYLIVLGGSSAGRRGWAIGVLLVSALLMRNEYLLIAAAFGCAACIYEWRQKDRPGRAIMAAYGLPALLAVAIALLVYSRALDRGPAFRQSLREKHTLNICQVFAFGYQQRHPEWTNSPWTGCEELTLRFFGRKYPTLFEAVAANPGEMFSHFLWNASLIPSGLQVLLFGRASGSVNPDYAPVTLNSKAADVLTAIVLVLYGLALWRVVRTTELCWQWVRPRIWGWGLMFCPAGMVLLVMLTQRPRPSYLFSLSILVMALTGFAVHVVIAKSRAYTWLFRAMPAAVLAFCLIPSYYRRPPAESPYALSVCYRRLVPFQGLFQGPGAVLLSAQYPSELCNYLGQRGCSGIAYAALAPEAVKAGDWNAVLDRHGVTMIYADVVMLNAPGHPPMLDRGLDAPGWRCIGYGDAVSGRWMVWRRVPGS